MAREAIRLKRGPWNNEERQYITDKAGSISPEEIAKKIRRPTNSVVKYMMQQGLTKYYHRQELENKQFLDIRQTRYWEELSQEFSDEELRSFQYHWQNIVKQFKDDILHTEEIQIVDAIKMEIKMHRCQKHQKETAENIDKIRLRIAEEEKQIKPDQDKLKILNSNVASLYASMEAFNKDFLSLLKEKNASLKQLKATREQRIQQIENSKETLVGWVKKLYTNSELRHDLGLKMEKMRLASRAEYYRLSEYYTFADGEVDKPILNSETTSMSDNKNT